MTTTKTKRPFSTGLQIQDRGFDVYAIRKRAEADPKTFFETFEQQIEGGKDGEGFRWSDVENLPDLYHALRDIDVTAYVDVLGRSAPITTGLFPLVTGALTVAGLNDSYMAVPTIGQELVSDFDSSKKRVTIAGVLSDSLNNADTEEGEEFPLIGASEERYDILYRRRGFRSQITSEMFEENDLTAVMDRVNVSGEIPAELIEEQTLKRVTDHDGSASSGAEPYVLHLGGAAQALFVTSNSTLTRLHASGNRVQNNALVDTTDLENVRERLAGMTNSRGRRIAIPMSEMILLVPDALIGTALKLTGSELEPGIENEVNNWGPRGRYRPRILTTPKLDDLSTSAWYMGAFPKQFRRKWKLRMELARLTGNDTENFVRRRVALEWRVAWDCEVGATDYVYVVQSLGGTTAPKDE